MSTQKNPDTKPADEVQEAEDGAPFEGEFDPQRARDLIDKLRSTVKGLRSELREVTAERDTLRQAEQERADAEKSEVERATEAAEKAQAELANARRELWLTKAIAKHGLDEDARDFLTGESEEEVLTRAERLAALRGSSASDAPKVTPAVRPTPALVPGHSAEPGGPTQFDPAAVASEVRSAV